MGEVPVKRWDALIDMPICRGTYDQRAMGRGVKNGVARESAMASAGQVTWCSQSLSTLPEAPRDRKKYIRCRGLIFSCRTIMHKVVTTCGFLGDKHSYPNPHEAKESELALTIFGPL